MTHRRDTDVNGDLGAARHELAVACRVMANCGIVEDVLGHISVRVDERHILIRCRGRREAGLRFTVVDDIRLVEADTGRVIDDPSGTFAPPSELPIHTAVLAARPDVSCVVHAHPPDVVVASLARVPLLPLFGAYNIPATRLAQRGIPVHPRSMLICTRAAGESMTESLGPASAVILFGHGVVTVGASVPEAVLNAIHVNTLARLTLAVHRAGAVPAAISDDDLAALPDLGAQFNEATLWRSHVATLHADGRGLEEHE
jgi:ribulose-5-phosphate 4-epimerase/fuculose-1-phosphate aldolase